MASKDYIPVVLKRIKTSNGYTVEIVFSLKDVFRDKYLLMTRENIINEFRKLISKIRNLINGKKPSKISRRDIWEIGHTILEVRKKIAEKHGVDITNIVQATAEELGVSESSIRYMVQFSAMIPKNKVKEKISWGKYQEAIKLIEIADFNDCIKLIERGELKTTKEIRKYVRQKNKERRRKCTNNLI